MNVPFVDLLAQYQSIKPEIDASIQSVIQSSVFIGGSAVSEFELAFAKYLEIDHCVACANGTDAIEIALRALGVGKGDEVIVPAMSWISTSEAVSSVGAKPVFVDILPDTFTIDTDKIGAKISTTTKAIIPVHLYGKAAEMDKILAISKKHKLFVIEDCAQAHGAEFQQRKTGTFGDVATFSFYPGKNLGAYGDAGCMVTNNQELASHCKMIANHGQITKHVHKIEGRNSRLDALQAAILSTKLKYLNTWTDSRISNARYYNEVMNGFGITLPIIDGSKHVFHLYVVNVPNRNEIKDFLNSKGINAQIHYPNALPMLDPYCDRENALDYPVACGLAQNGLSLPIFSEMTKQQIDYVAGTLKVALSTFSKGKETI